MVCLLWLAPHDPQTDRNGLKRRTRVPRVITLPLILLAVGVILLSLIGTPMWPWFDAYLLGHLHELHWKGAPPTDFWFVLLLSTTLVAAGIGLAALFYSRANIKSAADRDPVQRTLPGPFALLHNKFYVDEFYDATIVRLTAFFARISDWLERYVWGGLVWLCVQFVVILSWLDRLIDDFLINLGFDQGCRSLQGSGSIFSHLQNGQVQRYLRAIGLGLVALALIFIWGCK